MPSEWDWKRLLSHKLCAQFPTKSESIPSMRRLGKKPALPAFGRRRDKMRYPIPKHSKHTPHRTVSLKSLVVINPAGAAYTWTNIRGSISFCSWRRASCAVLKAPVHFVAIPVERSPTCHSPSSHRGRTFRIKRFCPSGRPSTVEIMTGPDPNSRPLCDLLTGFTTSLLLIALQNAAIHAQWLDRNCRTDRTRGRT